MKEASTPSAQVLGQLLIMQTMMINLPDEKSIFSFVCRGLSDIPGVAQVRHAGTPRESTDTATLGFPLCRGETCWGELLFTLSDSTAFEPCAEYLKNFCFMVAVILEERNQRHLNELHQIELEQRVRERTKQLTEQIAARELVEESLRQSEERLKFVLEGSQQGFWDWDIETNLVRRNERWAEMLGYTLQEIESSVKNWSNLQHPNDRAATWKSIQDHLQGLTPIHDIEYRMRTKEGHYKWLHDRARVVMRDSSGKPVRMSGTLTDITARKQAEEEKVRLEAQLRQAQKMEAIGTLAGGIAHDFNNILAGIMGYTEMSLLDVSPHNPLRCNLEEVLKGAYRARDLVKQILVFSRMRTGQEHRKVRFGRIVEEVLKFLRASLPATIAIHRNIESDADRILADPTQMHEMLINLCTNAAHAMEEKGGLLDVTLSKVHLDAKVSPLYPDLRPGPYLRLTVSDTGQGMDAETLEHIFEPYFTTKEVGKGTGFGLAVVHSIIKHHEGAITVHSEPGKGTTFQIYIPASEDVDFVDHEFEGPLPRGTERILFVDDEEMMTKMAGRMLKELGYRIRTHTSSREALNTFRTAPLDFDLLITDLTMPQMTGMDLAREVLLIRSDTSILLCTGFSEKISEAIAKEVGIKGFLLKPFSLRSLAESIRKVLDDE